MNYSNMNCSRWTILRWGIQGWVIQRWIVQDELAKMNVPKMNYSVTVSSLTRLRGSFMVWLFFCACWHCPHGYMQPCLRREHLVGLLKISFWNFFEAKKIDATSTRVQTHFEWLAALKPLFVLPHNYLWAIT